MRQVRRESVSVVPQRPRTVLETSSGCVDIASKVAHFTYGFHSRGRTMVARKLMVLLPLFLVLTVPLADAQQTGTADQPALPERSASSATTTTAGLDLAGCLELARQRQPRLAVQRASLAASQDGLQALQDLHVPTILEPQLPVR